MAAAAARKAVARKRMKDERENKAVPRGKWRMAGLQVVFAVRLISRARQQYPTYDFVLHLRLALKCQSNCTVLDMNWKVGWTTSNET